MKAGRCRCFKHGACSRLDWDARLMPPNAVARMRAHGPANMTDRSGRRDAHGTRLIGVSTVGVSPRSKRGEVIGQGTVSHSNAPRADWMRFLLPSASALAPRPDQGVWGEA
jgi:hypothetical protein